MSTPLTLAGLAFTPAASAIAFFALTEAAAAAAVDPSSASGFQTEQKKSWILKCKKTVSMSQKGVALTQAGNANCNTTAYWNFGPAVTVTHLPGNLLVTVRYTCGHVEG